MTSPTDFAETTPSSASSAGGPQRVRRKSAKVAAVSVAANIREEMSVPEGPTPNGKRSHSRAGSGGSSSASSASSVASSTGHGGGGGPSHPAAPAKNSKGQPKKKTALSTFAVEYLKSWMMSPDHIEHPYPTEDEKAKIMKETGIELKQLTNWFVNNRKRYWKPKVEELRRRSTGCGVSLQEIAAVAARATARPGAPRADAPAADVGGAASSESDDSARPPTPRERKPSSSSSGKKRKKYSVAASPHPSSAAAIAPRAAKKARDARAPQPPRRQPAAPVADPIRAPPAAPAANPGIHTATDFESVKAARKMSRDRIISDAGSSESDWEESEFGGDDGPTGHAGKSMRAVSNPLNAAASSLSASSSALVSPFNTKATEIVAGIPVAAAAATKPAVQSLLSRVPQPPTFFQEVHQQPLEAAVDSNLAVAELDYSISPLDNQVVANTGAAAAMAAAAVGFCCSVMPHSCNLADPLGGKYSPCALCSACRDWNLGEFCPWDLTGILGEMSAESGIPDPLSLSSTSSSSYSSSGSEADSDFGAVTDDALEEGFMAPVAALPPIAVAAPSSGSVCDVVDLSRGAGNEYDEEIFRLPPAMRGGVLSSNPSTSSFVMSSNDSSSSFIMSSNDSSSSFSVIPDKIYNSTSHSDFISSMVGIETWD